MTANSKGRCVGLIGGLGVGAAVHYYQELFKAHEAAGISMQLQMAHADMHRGLRYVQAGELGELARYLAELIGRLKAGGAEMAVIPAFTPHICIAELVPISPLPLVNILEVIGEEVRARKYRRLALFGTRFTIESRLFGHLKDVELVLPKPEELDSIHAMYFQLASTGAGSEEQRTRLTKLAHTLIERENLDAIVLAGTDLSLVFNESNTDFPHMDCSRLHIDAIMHRVLGG